MKTSPGVAVAVALLSAVCLAGEVAQAFAGWQGPGGRQRPPASFNCDRNNLTVYTGVVTRYRRRVGQTSLRIRTDADTTEQVTVKHPGTDEPGPLFRMNGEAFTPADWTRIESRKGVLRDGMRASAWVCTDGQVMVDWGVRREG